MNWHDLIVGGTSLLAALTGAGIAFWAQHSQWKRTRKAQAEDNEAAAIRRVLVTAMSIDSLAHQCAVAAKYRTSIDGTVFALFGSDGPISLSRTLADMNTAFDDLQDAGAYLWLNAEPETVRLGGEIATAVAALIEVHALGQHKPAYLRWLLNLLFGPPLAEPAKVEAARAKLATARTALTERTRERFNLDALPDPAGAENPLDT